MDEIQMIYFMTACINKACFKSHQMHKHENLRLTQLSKVKRMQWKKILKVLLKTASTSNNAQCFLKALKEKAPLGENFVICNFVIKLIWIGNDTGTANWFRLLWFLTLIPSLWRALGWTLMISVFWLKKNPAQKYLVGKQVSWQKGSCALFLPAATYPRPDNLTRGKYFQREDQYHQIQGWKL